MSSDSFNLSRAQSSHTDGSTLVISLLLLTLMSLLGLGAMLAAQQETRMAANLRTGIAAFHAAEAGIEQALLNHRNNTITSPLSGSMESSQYNTTVNETSGLYTVRSEGSHNHSGAHYTIQATFSGAAGTSPRLEQWNSHE